MTLLPPARRAQQLLPALLLASLFQAAHAWHLGALPADEVALYVQDLNTGAILAEHRADVSMNPASTMKLVTAFAALHALPADYRWRTEWKSAAPVRYGVLQGDLYWVGSGNPVFDQPDIRDMQAQLRAQGIHAIGGRVVFDRRLWPNRGSAEGFDSDADELFATPPDTHMVAYKALWATAGRDEAGRPQFVLDPPLPDTTIDTRGVRPVSSGTCRQLRQHISADYRDGVLSFRGRLPVACTGAKMYLNLFDSAAFARHSFRGHWLAGGGNDVAFAEGAAPASARVLAVNHSKSLASVLTDMNTHSNNVIARSVYLTLGVHEAGGRAPNAAAAVRRQLAAAGIDDEALVLENGAGLSRRERLTARLLGQVLAAAWRSPWRQTFVDSLPVPGGEGTLQGRLREAGPGLRLKTGTLKNVRALAGYWLPQQSQHSPLALVVLINSERSEGYLPELDRLMLRLLREAGALEKGQP